VRDWVSYDCHYEECTLCDDPRCECLCHVDILEDDDDDVQ
jgi:hypothetical protein